MTAERRLIKLLAVDWTEPFALHWLLLLNRGRKQIRTADYTVRDADYVMKVIELYLDVGLEEYLRHLAARLDEVKNARHPRKKVVLPNLIN